MRWSKTFTVVGCHCEGEVGNVVTGGMPPLKGASVFEKMLDMRRNHDDLRKLILFEPRGMAVNNTNVIVSASHPDADIGFIILESTEYPPMSGSNAICVSTVLLETGILEMREPITHLTLEAPAGLIKVTCECKDGCVERVTFVNQPSFAHHLDASLTVPGIGDITVDIAYGGVGFVMVDAEQLGLTLDVENGRVLCEVGERVKAAAAERYPIVHPLNPEIRDVSIIQIRGPMRSDGRTITGRSATVVRPGRLDRSACGTGTCARLAVLHAKRQIEVGQEFVHESIIGTSFRARILGLTEVGGREAVVPEVSGRGWLTHISQHGLSPTDPFPQGFTVPDTWLRVVN